MQEKISFTAKGADEFHSTLKHRVNDYFKQHNLSTKANLSMHVKTAVFLIGYSACYFGILLAPISWEWKMPLFFLMGLSIAGIGFNIMHDAAHGAYSSKEWLNNLLGYSLNVVGGNLFTWKIQHNILHHTYTNLYGYDEDLDAGIVVRLSPHAPRRSFHRFQHIYAWLAYSLVHLSWLIIKDFKKISSYNGNGLTYQNKTKPAKELGIIIVSKLLFFTYLVVIPLIYSNLLWWQYLIGFLIMSFTAGVVLSVVFQLAHVVEGTVHPVVPESRKIEANWARHQVETTCNFSMDNSLVNWYVGGLNFQIEHHLFPKICSIHYPALSKIVSQTSNEFGVRYTAHPTMWQAVHSHYMQLKQLGNE